MQKPIYNGPTDQARIDAAKAEGLPVLDGKQALSSARHKTPSGPAVNWYPFADGTETVRDDNGEPAQWPE